MLVNLAWNFHIFTLFLLFLIVSSQNSAEIFNVHSTSDNNAPSMAISVNNQDLTEVSTSVLEAETWLRTHVLPYYPSLNITHIVIGHNLLCSNKTHHNFHHLILPALKNIYHSLIRWGLQSEINVSPSISSHCLKLSPDLAFPLLRPLLDFLKTTNSSYIINPSTEQFISTQKIETLVNTHNKSLKKIGFLPFEDLNFLNVINPLPQEAKPTMRKLSNVLPTPSPEELPIARGPSVLPPLVGVEPTLTPSSPESATPNLGSSPSYSPQSHGHGHGHGHGGHGYFWPPCYPMPPQSSPGPSSEPNEEKLWCVAKPSVPAETLQEAINYACGEGGAECDDIQPNGNCYNPETLVAHASYAFNSYWQKNKINGGTCSFGGTAMLINSDPSFHKCRFIVG